MFVHESGSLERPTIVFLHGNGSAIWNNSGDTATLRDSNGTVVDTYSY